MPSDENNNLPDKLIYTKEVIEFVTVANEYCLLIESLNVLTREQFIEQAYKLLTLLHLKAVILPKPKNIINAETETFITEADWHFIDTGISTKLGSLETFNDLIEPATPDSPVNISLSECLTDTYQDLKDFTQLYQFGNEEAITEGLWECKNNFEQIWGSRIIIVLKEFHNLLYGNIDLATEENKDKTEIQKGDSKNWLDEIFEN
ncbi:MAG: DUF5063 domain-containing protein [Bacteroidales bacterium]|nr:DUF5063 domain-containing protein [Bacteroidales bacterium]